jgi:hypothetical protein
MKPSNWSQICRAIGSMNLLAERGEESWRAMGLLSAAVVLSACTGITQVPISRTDTSSTAAAPIEMRPLSPNEKAVLAKTLSQTVPNPSAARFKWLPVAVNGSGAIGYCGLVNVKIRNGEYVGFRRFFAMISKGPQGDYIKGQIEHMDDIPLELSGNSPEGGARQPGLTEENCKEWGYTDFSGAT